MSDPIEHCANAPLISIDRLCVHFPLAGSLLRRGARVVHAVNNLSLTLREGECLSVVGESGCGKSTLALSIIGLQAPTRGDIRFEGVSIVGPDAPDRLARAKLAQIVFQDPFSSFNPRQTIYTSLAAPLRLHGVSDRAELDARVAEMLTLVGLKPEQARRFPHEFSGGQRQRIGIARALLLKPKVLVLDEPVSALDVSIRAQIINLLLELKERLALSYLMISHDLSVVEHMSDRVAVMFGGQIVETGSWDQVFANPAHPYTRRLMGAILDPMLALDGRQPVQADEVFSPPAGFACYPQDFANHDVYRLPPPAQLLDIGGGQQILVRSVDA